jgi:hypothetical protein
MIDTNKYEGHLADALVAVREGGVDCDFSKIRIEDALDDMADLLAEVKRLRGILGDIVAIDEWGGDGKDVGITITYGDGYTFTGWLNRSYDEVTE